MKNTELYDRIIEELIELAGYWVDAKDVEIYRDLVERVTACVCLIHVGGVNDEIIATLYDVALSSAHEIKVVNNGIDSYIDDKVCLLITLIDDLYWDRYEVQTTPDKKE